MDDCRLARLLPTNLKEVCEELTSRLDKLCSDYVTGADPQEDQNYTSSPEAVAPDTDMLESFSAPDLGNESSDCEEAEDYHSGKCHQPQRH